MSLSRDTWHKHGDELIEAVCREFGLVKPLAMEENDGALCCASIAEAEPGACRWASQLCLTNCLIFLAKSAQSANLSAARLNSRSNQWTTSVVPEPFFPVKLEQVLHKAILRGSAFLVARKRALSSPASFQTASLSSAQHSIVKVGRCAVEFARKRLEPPLVGARRKR